MYHYSEGGGDKRDVLLYFWDDESDKDTYMHPYIPTYIHTYLPTHIRTYTHAYIHTYKESDKEIKVSMFGCVFVSVFKC